MFQNKVFVMIKIFMFVIAFISCLKAEFLLVEKREHGVSSISYKHLSENEKADVREYYRLLNRYAWPMVTVYYWNFSEAERQTYDDLLDQENGLEKFIKTEIEKKSDGRYTIIYAPTPLFELALAYRYYKDMYGDITAIMEDESTGIMVGWPHKYIAKQIEKFKVEDFQGSKKMENYLKLIQESFEPGNLNEFIIVNYFEAIEEYLENEQMINNKNFSKWTSFLSYFINSSPVYSDNMLQIINKIIEIDKEFSSKNISYILRGVAGFKDVLDLPDNSRNSLSFANSLFAGSVADRSITNGARTIDYMINPNNYAYFVDVNIKSYLKSMKNFNGIFSYFYIPPISTTAAFFGRGELFHVRTKTSQLENPIQGAYGKTVPTVDFKLKSELLFTLSPRHQFIADLTNYLATHTHIFKAPKGKEIESMRKNTHDIQERYALNEGNSQGRESIDLEYEAELQQLKTQFEEEYKRLRK